MFFIMACFFEIHLSYPVSVYPVPVPTTIPTPRIASVVIRVQPLHSWESLCTWFIYEFSNKL